MQAKKLAAQVAELRALPDNKRCWDCEQLGTTYYVPQFSIFVCTPCSGVHMQFGHRVKSVTLADYSAHEVEQMQQGGNQVAAYRWLARYTPGKDLPKPTDRNPQKTRGWIQTVFADKRFFSADAPIPRRSTDSAASAATAGGLAAAGGSGSGAVSLSGSSSDSFRRSSSAREGPGVPPSPAARTSPVGITSSMSMGRQPHLSASHLHSGSPPVHDVRDILGDRAPTLHVAAKANPEPAAAQAAPAAAPAPAAPSAAPPVPQSPASAVFDPFAAPTQPGATPAMQAMPVTPPAAALSQGAAGFEPFQQQQQPVQAQQQQQQPVPAQAATPAVTPAAAADDWAAFDDASAFPATSQPASSAAPAPASTGLPQQQQQQPPAVSASSNGGWADFGSTVVTSAPPASAPGSAVVGAGITAAAAAAPEAAASPAAAGSPAASVSAPAAGAAAAATGTPKGGKPPAKELAPDLFADFAPGGWSAGTPQQAVAMHYQQQAGMAAAMAGGVRPHMAPMGALQQPQMGMPGFGMGPAAMPQQQQPQVPAHLAWQVQQQAALQWQYQQQVQQGQQQQQQGAMPGYPGGISPRSAAAAGWGGAPGFGLPGAPAGYGMPGAYPGAMPGVATSNAGPGQRYNLGQGPPTSGPTSSGSGPASGGGSQWTLASAAAGVTEQNAFADLVDLKAALPSTSSAAPAAPSGYLGPAVSGGGAPPAPYLQQQSSFGQMGFGLTPPVMQAGGYGAAGMAQGAQQYALAGGYGAAGMQQMPQGAAAGGPAAAAAAYGQMGMGYGGGPDGMQPMQQTPQLQQPQQQFGGAYGQQQTHMQWGAPPAAAAPGIATQPDEGNPFA